MRIKVTDQFKEHFVPFTFEQYIQFCLCRTKHSSVFWRTTTGKALKIKSLDKRKLCSEGLSVLYADDKVTKMRGNGYLCGGRKNQNK